MVRVQFFASLRERLGSAETTMPWQEGTVRTLLAALVAREGDAWRQVLMDERVMVAVNHDVVTLEAHVVAGDEVAFFPPVTGG